MTSLRSLLAILAAAALSACSTAPPRSVDAAATQARLEGRRLRDPRLQEFLASQGKDPNGPWGLDHLTLAAFHFSPRLDVGRARLAEAEAAIRTATELRNPGFTWTPGYNRDAAPGATPWILGYALSLPLELAGAREHRTADARYRAEAARCELAQAAWEVRRAIRQALMAAHGAESSVALATTQRSLHEQEVRRLELQAQAGEGSGLSVIEARGRLQRADLACREGERALTTARSQLAEAIGVTLGALPEVTLSYQELGPAGEAVDPTAARRWAAQNRPDLLSALARYASAHAALQGEMMRYRAGLSLGPGYELDQGEGKWSLALGFTLPVLHRNQGAIAEAVARRDTAAAQFLALQHHALAEVERAVADHAAALGDLESCRALRANREEQVRRIGLRRAAGADSGLDQVRAEIALAEQQRAELEATLRFEQALGALEDAIQRPVAFPDRAWRESARSPER